MGAVTSSIRGAFSAPKPKKVLMLSLDNVGKSTIVR